MIPIPAILSVVTNKYFIIAFVAVSIFGVYKYQQYTIDSLRKDLQISEQNNQELEAAVIGANEAVESLHKDYKEKEKIHKEREELVKELREQNRELRKKLYREQQGKKPLEELAIAKPGLVEKAVNSGTKKVFECFEKISEGKEDECLEK